MLHDNQNKTKLIEFGNIFLFWYLFLKMRMRVFGDSSHHVIFCCARIGFFVVVVD